jgi:hypothetical protein
MPTAWSVSSAIDDINSKLIDPSGAPENGFPRTAIAPSLQSSAAIPMIAPIRATSAEWGLYAVFSGPCIMQEMHSVPEDPGSLKRIRH